MMDLLMQRDFLQQADALTKYKEFISKFPHILQRVPLSYVASFLGIAQQSLAGCAGRFHDKLPFLTNVK
jgi:hypothetical protein